MPHIECAGERDRLRCHCLGAVGRAREVLSRQCHRCPRSHLVNVKTLLAVLVYLIISHAFLALTDGIGPHTGERCLKYGHFFIGTLYGGGQALFTRDCRSQGRAHEGGQRGRQTADLKPVAAWVSKGMYSFDSRSEMYSHLATLLSHLQEFSERAVLDRNLVEKMSTQARGVLGGTTCLLRRVGSGRNSFRLLDA